MSTHKYTDIICVAVTVLALIAAVLFMNGDKIGITQVSSGDTESDMFSSVDLDSDWETNDAVKINLSEKSIANGNGGAYFSDNVLEIVCKGYYVITGELEQGSIEVNAEDSDKVYLLFNGVDITNETGAAITVEQADKVIITLAEGSENTVSCGSEYENSDIDGAVFSKDDLTVNGSGKLTVTAEYKHGIVCNDSLRFTGGEISVTAKEDALHANDSVRICNADIDIDAGDDGITASNDDNTSLVYIESGSVDMNSCYEGIEACTVRINGGEINIVPSDDGLNSTEGEKLIEINGGSVSVINSTGTDSDGFDSNGDIIINGGSVFISLNGQGSNCALDYGSESNGVCRINGGTVMAFGGSSMAESISEDSAQGFIMKSFTSNKNDTLVELKDADGNTLLSETVPLQFTMAVLSCEGLAVGDTCTVTVGETTEEITVDNTSVSSMSDMGGKGMMSAGGGKGGSENSMPGGEGTSMADGEIPTMPDGEDFTMPDGEDFTMPDGEDFTMPDGEKPSMPDGEDFSRPEGSDVSMTAEERPAMPGNENSSMTAGDPPAKPDGDDSSADAENPPEKPEGEDVSGQSGTEANENEEASAGGENETKAQQNGTSDGQEKASEGESGVTPGKRDGIGGDMGGKQGGMNFADISGQDSDTDSQDGAVSVSEYRTELILILCSAVILLFGLLIALLFKGRV